MCEFMRENRKRINMRKERKRFFDTLSDAVLRELEPAVREDIALAMVEGCRQYEIGSCIGYEPGHYAPYNSSYGIIFARFHKERKNRYINEEQVSGSGRTHFWSAKRLLNCVPLSDDDFDDDLESICERICDGTDNYHFRRHISLEGPGTCCKKIEIEIPVRDVCVPIVGKIIEQYKSTGFEVEGPRSHDEESIRRPRYAYTRKTVIMERHDGKCVRVSVPDKDVLTYDPRDYVKDLRPSIQYIIHLSPDAHSG